LNEQAKTLFHARFRINPCRRRTKQEAVADVIAAWSILGASVIEDTWDAYTLQKITYCLFFYVFFCCPIMRIRGRLIPLTAV
jgi:hypothetical protein